jgi:hypothetical protein
MGYFKIFLVSSFSKYYKVDFYLIFQGIPLKRSSIHLFDEFLIGTVLYEKRFLECLALWLLLD